ncbi:MAG: hypothetical protein IPP34_07780 [Bacteroidetes bacterium]|nr:hypothetical protein [Bacteroidota bacterium]
MVAFEWRTLLPGEEIMIKDDQWSDVDYEEMPIPTEEKNSTPASGTNQKK